MKSITDRMEDYVANMNDQIAHYTDQIEDYKNKMIECEKQITQIQINKDEYIRAINILKRSQNGIY